MASYDAVICGAGVIGCAIARDLAASGFRVLVLDRGLPGDEASSAAAGLLTPQSGAEAPGPFADLERMSLALYPALVAELMEETGIPIEFRRCGTLRVAGEGAEETELSSLCAWQKQAGWAVERVETVRLAAIAGAELSGGLRSGAFFPEEGIVDNPRLARALWLSAEKRGATFWPGRPAVAIRIDRGACVGVETEAGRLDAPVVINAAGSWAPFDRALPFPIPIRPARGQIVELSIPRPGLACTVRTKDFYATPRSDGRVLLGSTVEFVGFEKTVTAGAMRKLLARGLELLPALAEARFTRAWAGLRPAAPDALPILGGTPVRGLWVATGHFRSGILLAPVTAQILSALIRGEDAGVDLGPFRIERFASAAAPSAP